MQVRIQGRWGKKRFTGLYTAPAKTKQSKQYQISAPNIYVFQKEYGVSDYMENPIFLGL